MAPRLHFKWPGDRQQMKRLLLTVLLAAAQIAFAGANKLSPDLTKSGPQLIDVIVQFQHGTNKSDYDNNVKQVGNSGRVKAKLDKINAVVLTLPAQAIQALAANPSVAYVSPNRSIKRSL